MKHLHKFASVLLALVMAFALMAPAFASSGDEPNGDNQNSGSQATAMVEVPNMENHKFEAYQIFTGTQEKRDKDDAPLADIAWGTGIKGDAFLAALKASDKFGETNPFTDVTTATGVADVLKGQADNSAMAIAFANIAVDYIDGQGQVLVQGTGNRLPVGYYLIVDTTEEIGTGDARNAVLLQLTSDVTVTVKVDVPKVEKEVEENRENAGFGDAADYSIGDDVPFQFISAVPDMTQFETYKYVFHDTMVEGLTFNKDSVEISINGGTPISETLYKVVTKEEDENLDCTFEIRFENLKSAVATERAVAGNPITITFTAKLNEKAVVGSMGNSNKVKLEYSNNPNDSGDGDPSTGETPEDEVLVFTYELDTTKVDTADPNKKLKDAEFHLSRVVKNENNEDVTVWAVVDETTHKITAWVPAEVGQTGYTAADAEGNLNGIAYAGSVLKSGDDGVFKVAGLDNGTYGLLETKAPAGYTTPKEAFTVVVTSTLSNKGEKPEVESLNVTIGDTNGTGDASSGIVAGTIGNGQGATLPETGGIGTTIFYVVGGLLTVGAVVLLVTKKRMSVDSDK